MEIIILLIGGLQHIFSSQQLSPYFEKQHKQHHKQQLSLLLLLSLLLSEYLIPDDWFS